MAILRQLPISQLVFQRSTKPQPAWINVANALVVKGRTL